MTILFLFTITCSMTTMILAALSAGVDSSFSIFYEPKAERADLRSGKEMNEIFRVDGMSYDTEDVDVGSITFDYYNADGTTYTNSGTTLSKENADESIGEIDVFRVAYEDSEIGTVYNVYILSSLPIYAAADSSYMFANLTFCTSYNFSNFNTSEVEDMSFMFSNASSFAYATEAIDLGNGKKVVLDLVDFDTRNCTNVENMFEYFLGEAASVCRKAIGKIFVGENFRLDKAIQANSSQMLFSESNANWEGMENNTPQSDVIAALSDWREFLYANAFCVIGFYAADFNAMLQEGINISFSTQTLTENSSTINYIVFDKFQSDAETPGTYIDGTSGIAFARNYNWIMFGGEGIATSDWVEVGQMQFAGTTTTYGGYEDYLLDRHKIFLGFNAASFISNVHYLYFLSDTQIYIIDGGVSHGYYMRGYDYASQYREGAGMFANLRNIYGFKFNNFSTELMEDMEYMFYNSATWGKDEFLYAGNPTRIKYCTSPQGMISVYDEYYLDLNLSAFDFSYVSEQGFDNMFSGASEDSKCGIGAVYGDDLGLLPTYIFSHDEYGLVLENSVLVDRNNGGGYITGSSDMYEPKPWE